MECEIPFTLLTTETLRNHYNNLYPVVSVSNIMPCVNSIYTNLQVHGNIAHAICNFLSCAFDNKILKQDPLQFYMLPGFRSLS